MSRTRAVLPKAVGPHDLPAPHSEPLYTGSQAEASGGPGAALLHGARAWPSIPLSAPPYSP